MKGVYMSSKQIKQINTLQKQLNVLLASQYESLLDNQLTAKQVLILELIRAGVTSSTELSQHAQVSTSAISQLLNKLENQDYITRTINPENRRKIEIALAEKSIQYFEQTSHMQQQINEAIYGQLPEEDLAALVVILKKLLHIASQK